MHSNNEQFCRIEVVMAFSEFEQKRYEKMMSQYIESRRPEPKIRNKVDLSFRVYDYSVEVFEVRPHWKDASVIQTHSIAKATFVNTQQHWKIFWMRSDLKWHTYKPDPTVDRLESFIEVLETDEMGCFWG
ncbi:DUF3024 domain-containing protein [Vibrio nitrifigilis]|nr:DUF3024 domain-containing protein [Vibrio nitrifigilis]